MRFRLRAFGLHLLASFIVLTLILGTLYFGWYRWPGWYLADVTQVVLVLPAVDLVLGPLLTFIVASAKKPRRELVRDICIIAAMQLIALGYGTVSLWSGRPLYYAFSENVLQMVQAYDIDADEVHLAEQQKATILPHWYSLPRWIWAPLPQDADQRSQIVTAAITGGNDVISMPRYYQPWERGLPMLKAQLKKVADVAYFSRGEKTVLAQHMQAAGFSPDQANAIPLTGRGKPLLAVLDPNDLKISAIFKAR